MILALDVQCRNVHLEALLYIVFSNPTCSLWPCINRHLSEPQLTSPPLIHPLPCGPLKPRAPLSNCSLKSWRVTKGQEQGNTCCLYPHSPESAPARYEGSNVLLGHHTYIYQAGKFETESHLESLNCTYTQKFQQGVMQQCNFWFPKESFSGQLLK